MDVYIQVNLTLVESINRAKRSAFNWSTKRK